MRALALALLLAGCASPDPRLYTLETVPGAPVQSVPGARLEIAVQAVSVPRYLQRLEIVRSVDATRARVSDNDWWMEPMGAMVRRTFAADLAQRRPDALVLPNGQGSGRNTVSIGLDIQEFDRTNDRIVLSGTLRASHEGSPATIVPVRADVPVAGDAVSDQVTAMSRALATVADVAAGLTVVPAPGRDG